jgi:hypothetical protein
MATLDESHRQARCPKVAGAMAPEFPQYGGGDEYTSATEVAHTLLKSPDCAAGAVRAYSFAVLGGKFSLSVEDFYRALHHRAIALRI